MPALEKRRRKVRPVAFFFCPAFCVAVVVVVVALAVSAAVGAPFSFTSAISLFPRSCGFCDPLAGRFSPCLQCRRCWRPKWCDFASIYLILPSLAGLGRFFFFPGAYVPGFLMPLLRGLICNDICIFSARWLRR